MKKNVFTSSRIAKLLQYKIILVLFKKFEKRPPRGNLRKTVITNLFGNC